MSNIEMTEMLFLSIGSSAVYQSTWYKLSSNSKNSQSKIIFSGFLGLIISNIVLLSFFAFFMDGFYQFLGLTKNTGYLLGYLVLINIFSLGLNFSYNLDNWVWLTSV